MSLDCTFLDHRNPSVVFPVGSYFFIIVLLSNGKIICFLQPILYPLFCQTYQGVKAFNFSGTFSLRPENMGRGQGELLYASAVTPSYSTRLAAHFRYSVSMEKVPCSAEVVTSVEKN